MNDEPEIELELDLREMLCPLPMVKISKSIANVPIGGVIRAVATDPTSLSDIPAWTRATGNELVSSSRAQGECVFLIRRLK